MPPCARSRANCSCRTPSAPSPMPKRRSRSCAAAIFSSRAPSAKLLQLAAVAPNDSVLDVACATGYSTAVIAKLAKTVIGLEQDADLVRIASEAVHSCRREERHDRARRAGRRLRGQGALRRDLHQRRRRVRPRRAAGAAGRGRPARGRHQVRRTGPRHALSARTWPGRPPCRVRCGRASTSRIPQYCWICLLERPS